MKRGMREGEKMERIGGREGEKMERRGGREDGEEGREGRWRGLEGGREERWRGGEGGFGSKCQRPRRVELETPPPGLWDTTSAAAAAWVSLTRGGGCDGPRGTTRDTGALGRLMR
ncbi:hypothetical protein Pmani_036767 [Petrolisthes manimaculis]|uniref:Uncharacterized protein n=1 Tax=Petrolisthes manimaculis TaxID=1843537 RepID=A0AAE1NJI5_9EUCA|nr:hypothetical protein Pmani_036767 [Petrolisthes manimaculis]